MQGAVRPSVVVSDAHLSLEPSSRRTGDGLAAALGTMSGVELVLAGDIFDLSVAGAPVPASGAEGAALLDATLRFHRDFSRVLAERSMDGGSVTIIPGNHDPQITAPSAQSILHMRVSPTVAVTPWFHVTKMGVHVEHGHFYDPVCITMPAANDGPCSESLGSAVSRFASKLPGVDPDAVEPLESLEPAGVLAWCGRHLEEIEKCAGAISRIDTSPIQPKLLALPGAAPLHTQLVAEPLSLSRFIETGMYRRYGARVIAAQRTASRCIQAIYRDCRVVVMGHSHAPEMVATRHGLTMNCGSWKVEGASVRGTCAWIDPDGARLIDWRS